MNDSPIKGIVITGHYAAGKGPVGLALRELLSRDFPSLKLSLQKDRTHLEAAVRRDVTDMHAPQPGVEGPHSIIRQLGPPLVFDVKDGSLHHEAHTNMIRSIGESEDGHLLLLEIADGPDVSSFGLRQTGEHLVGLLHQFDVMGHTLVVEVDAPYDVRYERNQRRDDRVSDSIFEIAAADGGEVYAMTTYSLGDRYYRLSNGDNGDVAPRVATAYQDFVRPRIEQTVQLLEGAGRPPGWVR